MATEGKTRDCPFCKEEIKADAIKCKHCSSSVAPEKAPHGGTCPFCKEEIKADAIKCKHCKSNLGGDAKEAGCGCEHNVSSRAQMTGRFPLRAQTVGRLSLAGDAFDWMCDSTGTMWCADASGTFTECGSCSPGYDDDASWPSHVRTKRRQRSGVSDLGSWCLGFCLENICGINPDGSVDAGCFLHCVKGCSVFNASPGLMARG